MADLGKADDRALLERHTKTQVVLGTIGLIGAGGWVLSVVLLHFIKSDLDPIDTYVSDYAIGDNGWLMSLAFLMVGVGTLAIAVGLRAALAPGKRVVASWVLTAIAGVGFLLAGLFTGDPTGAEDLTTRGTIHVLGALLVFPTMVLGAFFLRGVFRRDARWSDFASKIRWVPWVLLACFLVSFGTSEDGPLGLTQRLFAFVIMAWLAALAQQLRTHG
jgi:hypothetical protein